MGVNPITKEARFPIESINIIKVHGQSARDSRMLSGFALNIGRAAQGMPSEIYNAKIACLDFDIRKSRLPLGFQVSVNNPHEVERIRTREEDLTKERIKQILDKGANVVLTTRGIDDMSMKYFVEAGAIACRRVLYEEMKRVAMVTGAEIVMKMVDQEGDETFNPSSLGFAKIIYEDQIGVDEIIYFKSCKNSCATTLLLRGANSCMLDEIERSLYDALCVVKRVLEGGTIVFGGGAVETATSAFLENFSNNFESREQLPIVEFADALLVIPKTLAVNAAKDATELVAKLRSHYLSIFLENENQNSLENKYLGLNLTNDDLNSTSLLEVLEPTISKVKMIQFATEVAITILRIDDFIKLDAQRVSN